MKHISLSVLLLVLTAQAHADSVVTTTDSTSEPVTSAPATVNSDGFDETIGVIPSPATVTRTGSKTVVVRIQNSCFGTNLRSVSNPVSPNGIITAAIGLKIGDQDMPLTVSYPGDTVSAAGMNSDTPPQAMAASTYTLPAGSRAGLLGNTVQIEIPVSFTETIDPDGNVTTTDTRAYVSSSSFSQKMVDCSGPPAYGAYGVSRTTPAYPCGQFMGQNGPLSANVKPAVVSADNTQIQIDVAFPGQTGFCGGYYSPLMLFLSDARPAFLGTSDFPLNSIGSTAWPEKGAPGAFLVIDREHRGKVDRRDQLFGDSENAQNGFEALRALDSDKDGWITAADRDFKNLYLWFDRNGDGKVQKGEMVPAAKMISKISLDYTKGHLRPIGRFAEEREISTVILKNKKKKAVIADIWLSPKMKNKERLSGL